MTAIFDSISTPVEIRIATGFSRINTAMRSRAWGQAASNGLTPTQADILHLLSSRNKALRLSAIAEYLAVSSATASDAVTSLVEKGLVEKTRAIDDGRAIALKLTKNGSKLAIAVPDWSSFLGSAVDTLNDSEKSELLRLVVKMIRQMQVNGEIPPNRMCVTCKYFGPNESPSPEAPHYCHFVEAPFENKHLRLDCPEHEDADIDMQLKKWAAFNKS